MAAPLQRIFPRLGSASLSFLRKATGAIGVWTQAPAMFLGSASRYVGPDAGTSQVQAAPSFSAVPNGATHTVLCAQFFSDPLREQTIAAGSWRIGFGAQLANAGVNFTWRPQAALHVVNGITGTRRGTIFPVSNVGAGGRTATTEQTALGSVTGIAVQVRTGDYLCLELGLSVTNAAGALAPQASVWCDGATPISSDAAATTSAMAVVEAPASMALSLPTTGERPDASVSATLAPRIVKDMWPPHTDQLYAWDESDRVVKKFFDFLGDAIKLYGYDEVDRAMRESSPATCVELLPAWEATLGIALSRVALAQRSPTARQQAVLARLRELGPLTLHNLAAIFAQLAAYVPPSAPEVIEPTAAEIETACTWSETVPSGSGVVNSGAYLIRSTPVLLDGAHVSDGGVLVKATFDVATLSGLSLRLASPDYVFADWTGISAQSTQVVLRSLAHEGKAVHGNWRLYVTKAVGAPAIELQSWSLLVQGKGHGGRAFTWWSVYLDSSHQAVDRRDVEATLDRITQAYARGFAVYSKTSLPGTAVHRPGRFLPGSP